MPSRLSKLEEKRAFQRSLLRWYKHHGRDLPWRRDRDPYPILVSEFMLQQTRVETVLAYYENFLRRFPTLADLARAPLEEILKSWAGLGYYGRARNLHAAARTILRHFGGKIPATRRELLNLPGFGSYMAGAVASMAFGERVAALDGNVQRVLSRFLDLPAAASAQGRKRELEEMAAGLVPVRRAGDFNQSLMDLGAMVCSPLRPGCPECPLRESCLWKGEDHWKAARRKRSREETWAVAIVQRGGKLLLHRKGGEGLLSGLYQFPVVVLPNEACVPGPLVEPARKALRILLREDFGLKARVGRKPLPFLKQAFTHLRVTLVPFLCWAGPENSRSLKGGTWIHPAHFSRIPLSRAMSRVAGQFLQI